MAFIRGRYWEEPAVVEFCDHRKWLTKLKRDLKSTRKMAIKTCTEVGRRQSEILNAILTEQLREHKTAGLAALQEIGPKTVEALISAGMHTFEDMFPERLRALSVISSSRIDAIIEAVVNVYRTSLRESLNDFLDFGPRTRRQPGFAAYIGNVEYFTNLERRFVNTLREIKAKVREVHAHRPPSPIAFSLAVEEGTPYYNEPLGWGLMLGSPIVLTAWSYLAYLKFGSVTLSLLGCVLAFAMYLTVGAQAVFLFGHLTFQLKPPTFPSPPRVSKSSADEHFEDVIQTPTATGNKPKDTAAEDDFEEIEAEYSPPFDDEFAELEALEREYYEKLVEELGTIEEEYPESTPTVPVTKEKEKKDRFYSELADRINRTELILGDGFRGELYAYQRTGAKFLISAKKALLGDEMGLGKTIQALAALVHLANTQGDIRVLILCPAGLTDNWKRETRRFTSLRPMLIAGSSRQKAYRTILNGHADIGIASYETFIRDYPYGPKVPADWDWESLDVVVMDEAQRIRNPDASTAINAKKLASKIDYRFLITGTPLENRIEDFYSLSEALGSPLGNSSDLWTEYGHIRPRTLQRKASSFYLRRKKEDVFEDLPPLIEQSIYLDLLPQQRKEYNEILMSTGKGWDAIMHLRQAANMSSTGRSSKLQYLLELLSETEQSGDKVIVFSFFVKTLEVLQQELDTEYLIYGDVPQQKRTKLIDKFNKSREPETILIQIRAGGTGLNLQAANHVVIFEPQWNPAVESQAIARAHRMNQEKKVHAVRLLARDTIEERMEARLAEKRAVFDDYVDQAQLAKKLSTSWNEILKEECRRAGISAA
ncbi:MAG: SNF2-related protein [Planctomycetota bacterium]|nr:SNF2-related protein [Planctomycetota bacterium]MDA1137258.1 SNF2-related protein [Planctomycetota bacterium]